MEVALLILPVHLYIRVHVKGCNHTINPEFQQYLNLPDQRWFISDLLLNHLVSGRIVNQIE